MGEHTAITETNDHVKHAEKMEDSTRNIHKSLNEGKLDPGALAGHFFGMPKNAEISRRSDGTYTNPQSTEITRRPDGTYTNPQNNEITRRPDGTYTNPQNNEITRRPDGTYANPQNNEITRRPDGTYANPQNSEITVRPDGTYTNRDGKVDEPQVKHVYKSEHAEHGDAKDGGGVQGRPEHKVAEKPETPADPKFNNLDPRLKNYVDEQTKNGYKPDQILQSNPNMKENNPLMYEYMMARAGVVIPADQKAELDKRIASNK